MNTRIIRFLFGTTIALAIALLLLAVQVPMPVSSAQPPPGFHIETAVTTTTDEYDTSGSGMGCSLREAIKSMNDVTNFGGCVLSLVSGVGPDQVFLPSSTYTLTLNVAGEDLDVSGDLDVRRSMLISATGATPPIVRGDLDNEVWGDRIFHILTGTVTIQGIVIREGNELAGVGGGGLRIESGQSLTLNDGQVSISDAYIGGGIYNAGTLTLTNVTLNGNYNTSCSLSCGGGGIYNVGTATLTNVTLSGALSKYGGGIYNTGTLSLTNGIVRGNDNTIFPGGAGGGIYNNGGIATLADVTVSGNSAAGDAAGICNCFTGTLTLINTTISNNNAGGYGGGMANYNSTMTLTNVTFSGNFANYLGGGMELDGGMANLTNVTVSSNKANFSAGGIYWTTGGTKALTNTIVANNSGGNCGPSLGGSFNLSSDGTCGFGAGRDNISVMLAPLGNYGGPTLTYMLKPGSPAIDFGTNTGCPINDQRSKSRPVNGTCDVGAVERQPIDFSYWLNLPLIMK